MRRGDVSSSGLLPNLFVAFPDQVGNRTPTRREFLPLPEEPARLLGTVGNDLHEKLVGPVPEVPVEFPPRSYADRP